MSQRLTNFLGYLTLFAILGAIWVLFGEDPSREQGGRGEATFEGLASRVNDTGVLKLSKEGQVTTLVKGDAGWTILERGGFAADQDKVLGFLRGIARSERREPKTSNPDRFDRIGLGPSALAVTLRDQANGLILAFDMGDRSEVTSDRSLTYIFQESDTRSWLVTALADAAADPATWLPGTLLDLNAERLASIDMSGAVLTRRLGKTDFTLDSLADGETPRASWQLSEPARLIARLGYEDVMQLGNPLSEPVATVKAITHDGLALTLGLYEMDGSTWVQLAAAYDDVARDAGEGGELPAAPANGAEEAAALAALSRGWFFKLADYDAEILRRTRADFLEAEEVSGDAAP